MIFEFKGRIQSICDAFWLYFQPPLASASNSPYKNVLNASNEHDYKGIEGNWKVERVCGKKGGILIT